MRNHILQLDQFAKLMTSFTVLRKTTKSHCSSNFSSVEGIMPEKREQFDYDRDYDFPTD
jgi:hypothetical protein